MILSLHVPGTSVRKRGQALDVRVPASTDDAGKLLDAGEKYKVSFQQVTSVVISGRVSITVPVLQELSRNAIPVILVERNAPLAVLNPFASHGSVRVRKEQLRQINGSRGFHVARMLVKASLENKARLLLLMAKNRKRTRPSLATRLRASARLIRAGQTRLQGIPFGARAGMAAGTGSGAGGKTMTPLATRQSIMGIEGDGARVYFDAIADVVPAHFQFHGRNRRPPRDPVNAMLSLGYAILQGYVTIGVAAAGLEPYAGVLHADRSGKPSLVLDLMEPFRQAVVDRIVLSLVNRGAITLADFEQSHRGVLLGDSGKEVFYPAILKRLAPLTPLERQRDPGGNRYGNILKQARDCARFFLGMVSRFKPHLMQW